MALNSGQLTELWKSGQLFELGLPGITDSQEQINNVMRMIGFPDTYGDYNNMTASGSTIMAPPDDPSHSSPSSSDPSLSSSQSGLGASGSQVPDNTLLLTFRVERKGNVLNHHYYDFRKTGRTVTPMIIRCRLSNDWFCGQCLSGLGNGPADAGRTCQLCSITNNAVVLHHTQMQVTPMCFVCTGSCYLGHIHHIRPQEETIMVLQYSSQVDVEADRAALYEKEEQQLVQSGHASWARICFMPKRLKPREIMRDHAHYHIGFEIRLGHHHVFSFRNQICMQKDLAPPVTGPGECIDACYPSDSSPPLPLYFPSLLSGWYNKIQCVTSAFYPDLPTANPPPPGSTSSSSSSSAAPGSAAGSGAQTAGKTGTQTTGTTTAGGTGGTGGTTGVAAGDPKFKNFPGLVSPALLCTSRGCDTQFSDLFIAPPLVTDREKESKRIQTVEDLCTLSDGLSLSSKKRLLDDIRRRLGVDDPIG